VTPASAALFLASGLVGTALGRLAVFVGVDRVGASVNSAVISTRPLFASLLAVLALGETVTTTTVAGIVVLVGGLAALALSRGGDVTGWQPRDLLFPLAAAAAFAVGNVARKFGLDAFAGITLLEAVALNELGALVALAAYAVAAGRGDVLDAPRRTYAYFAGSGTLTAVALFSLFAALQIGRVVVVDPLAATAPLFTAVFAAVLLRDLERVTPRLVAGAVLIVVGVVLVVVDPAALP
jgi:drug/metabolite transporter (DMT)-like permease